MWLILLTLIVASHQPAHGAAATEEVTLTSILGIEIGMPVADARRVLQPLGRSGTREGPGGAKEVWSLERTGFEWVAMRSDATGRVVWITGYRRSGREIPFDAIPGEPAVATDAISIWHARGAHTSERLTLRGANRRGLVVTLLEVKP